MNRFAKTTETLIRQSLAWVAVFAVCANPMIISASQCGCGKEKASQPAVAKTAPAKSCCGGHKAVAEKATQSCCSSHERVPAVKSSACKCGDKCQCSNDDSKLPVPAVPANSQPQTDHLSVALPAETAFANHPIRMDHEIRYGRWLVHPPELTALETCALLSRFTC